MQWSKDSVFSTNDAGLTRHLMEKKKKKANLSIDLAPTHKNEWKMDHGPTYKRQKYKTSKKKT